jgi:glycosyltransferase involved in cell wall biosynthesis
LFAEKKPMSNSKKLISIIIPVYNEGKNLKALYDALNEFTAKLKYDFEFIFVDDDSADDSVQVLHRFAKKDDRIRIIELSRNFGKEAALSAGLHACLGDAAIMIDADMQMPVVLIKEFLIHWDKGSEVVVGVFSARSMSHVRALGAKSFYGIMGAISHIPIVPHATDFRLVDRQVIDTFNELSEHNRMTRGLIDWIGFRRSYIYFEQAPRLHGEPNYSFSKLIKLAVNGLTAFSLVPLKLAGYLGVAILFVSIPVGLFMYIDKYLLHTAFGESIRGTAFVAILTLFLIGVVLACLGLMSLYIAHIYDEVLDRPLYVVRRQPRKIASTQGDEGTNR